MDNILNILRKISIPVLVIIVLIGIVVGILKFQKDSKKPEISIVEPKEGITTEAESMQVKGSTNSKANQVFVNGNQAEVADNGDFTADVMLKEGENNLVVEAVSKSGKSVSETRSVIRSKKASPLEKGEISRDAPESGDVPKTSPNPNVPSGGEAEVSSGQIMTDGLTTAGPKENATIIIGSFIVMIYYYIKSKRGLVVAQRN